MTLLGIAQIVMFFAIVLAVTKPVGVFMYRVFEGERTFLHPLFRPLERAIYWLGGVREDEEQSWVRYSASMISLSVFSFLFVYLLQRLQGHLPLNPMHFSTPQAPQNATPMTPDLAFNTAVSFLTNTNWQSYSPDTTVSYFTQMTAFAVQNFVSAAVGIAVAIAMIRGFARHTVKTIGNFWVDVTRATIYILLPVCVLATLFFVWQGSIQNFKPPVIAQTLEGSSQTIEQGPLASQEAIKMLGTNGGGFFNANSAHPYENPTPFSNFVQMIVMLVIPAALCVVFGRMVGDKRQGYAILAAMTIAFAIACWGEISFEQAGNPLFTSLHVDQSASAMQAGGNAEGKEVRFGIAQSGIFTVATTAASCGAVNNAHDSLTPMGGFVPLLLIQLGEVIFGGVGSGLYGMLVFAMLAVFVAGLMIGRTPEYIGKKIESYEMKMVSIVVLLTPFLVLLGASIGVLTTAGQAGIANPGPHGFSEILYAYSSAANNNGSAFAGLTVSTPFYNITTGIAMWFGRFGSIIPVLAIAGALAAKKRIATTAGSLPTHGPLFVVLLLGTVVLVGALTYVPALALGPVVEHLMMLSGK